MPMGIEFVLAAELFTIYFFYRICIQFISSTELYSIILLPIIYH